MNLAIKFGENNEFQSPKSWKSDRIVRRCYLPLVIFLKKITHSYNELCVEFHIQVIHTAMKR